MTRTDKLQIQLAEVKARYKDEVYRIRGDRSKTYRQQDEILAELEERHADRVEDLTVRIKEAQHLDAQDREAAVQELLARDPNPERYRF